MKKKLSLSLPILTAVLNSDLRSFILKLPADHFRDVPFRYLGYGFALGRALSYHGTAKESDPFYLLGSTYMLGHCLYRLYQVIGPSLEDELGNIPRPAARYCAVAVYDTVIWDCIASLAAPSAIIYWVCWASDCLLNVVLDERESMMRRWMPVLLSILTFPLLVQPVDDGVDRFMTAFVRPIYDNYERLFFSWLYSLKIPNA
ncbi:Mitochondrial fission process protein 1 [Bulinus truncatus]|nr:Mitochondrial fission process protein 1 [Bulinus truncatus]